MRVCVCVWVCCVPVLFKRAATLAHVAWSSCTFVFLLPFPSVLFSFFLSFAVSLGFSPCRLLWFALHCLLSLLLIINSDFVGSPSLFTLSLASGMLLFEARSFFHATAPVASHSSTILPQFTTVHKQSASIRTRPASLQASHNLQSCWGDA